MDYIQANCKKFLRTASQPRHCPKKFLTIHFQSQLTCTWFSPKQTINCLDNNENLPHHCAMLVITFRPLCTIALCTYSWYYSLVMMCLGGSSGGAVHCTFRQTHTSTFRTYMLVLCIVHYTIHTYCRHATDRRWCRVELGLALLVCRIQLLFTYVP